MKKIAFIIPMLQPYRVSFYTRIVEMNPNIDFLFFHGITNSSARPAFEGEVKFKIENYFPFQIKLGPYELYFNKKLFRKVKKYSPDLIILFGNSGVITNQLLVRWAKMKKIKICLWVCSWDSQNTNRYLKSLKYFITKKYS